MSFLSISQKRLKLARVTKFGTHDGLEEPDVELILGAGQYHRLESGWQSKELACFNLIHYVAPPCAASRARQCMG